MTQATLLDDRPWMRRYMAAPVAVPARVALPAPLPRPSGGVDLARRTLGKSGAWPVPEPGRFCGADEESDDE